MGVAANIGTVAKEKKVSLKELSALVDVPYTTLYHAVKRDSKMELGTVQKVADALHIFWLDLYPEEQRESIAWDATQKGMINPYQQKSETVSSNRALQMGLISLPMEWSPKKRASYYFELLNECGQNVAIETAKSRVSELKKGNAAEFAFYMNSMDDKSLYLIAQTLEELVNLQAYQKPIEDPTEK